MAYLKPENTCINCKDEDFRFRRGYCSRCYPLIFKIEKIEQGILPRVLQDIEENLDFIEKAKIEYIRQVKHRLDIIKDAHIVKDVSAHDLEYRINSTLKLLDNKTLGKINDPIAHYLKDNKARAYVYRLFSTIQLLKPFKINYYKIYRSGDRT